MITNSYYWNNYFIDNGLLTAIVNQNLPSFITIEGFVHIIILETIIKSNLVLQNLIFSTRSSMTLDDIFLYGISI